MKSIISAMCLNRGIGIRQKLPWHIPEDLKFFKETTTGKNILMGRNTFDSLRKPLPNRMNYVLTRDTTIKSEIKNLRFVSSISEVPEDCIIIGGEQIYKMFINKVDVLYITQIYNDYKCDTFFPKIPDHFRLYSCSDVKKYGDIKFCFVVYKSNLKKQND